MGINYYNMIMYGKEFDSLHSAVEFLVAQGLVREEELDELEEYDGEFLTFQPYSFYNESEGILGCKLSAQAMLTDMIDCKMRIARVDSLLGEGCELYEFVQMC